MVLVVADVLCVHLLTQRSQPRGEHVLAEHFRRNARRRLPKFLAGAEVREARVAAAIRPAEGRIYTNEASTLRPRRDAFEGSRL